MDLGRRRRIGRPPIVFEEGLGGGSATGVQGQRGHEQIDAERSGAAEEAEVVLTTAHGPDGVRAGGDVIGQARHAGPVPLGGGADGLADEIELVHVAVAGQEGGAQDELGEDEADGPDVDGAGVVPGPEQ